MTENQLSLLFVYIANEIQLQSLRGSGMTWQRQQEIRNDLKTKLLASTLEIKIEKTPVDKGHDSPNNFSPLQIEMLMFAHYAGHRFQDFPNLSCPAQQQSLYRFISEGLVHTHPQPTAGHWNVELTKKGSMLVNKILNTTV